MEPETRGDPVQPLVWTTKSTGNLAGELGRAGRPVSADTVGRLLKGVWADGLGEERRQGGGRHRYVAFEDLPTPKRVMRLPWALRNSGASGWVPSAR